VQSSACKHILSKIQVLFLEDITVLEALCDVLLVSKACNLQFLLGLSLSTVLYLTLTCTHLLHMLFSCAWVFWHQTLGLKEAIYII
jgi:hypothetical protein